MTTSVSTPVTTTQDDLSRYAPLIASGKVRDLYDIGPESLIFVASDRVSAFDVVMSNGVPDKGAILTRMSQFWFDRLPGLVSECGGPVPPTHFLSVGLPPNVVPVDRTDLVEKYKSRTMVVRKLKVVPIESIVRGYITGSAWVEYKESGTIHGIPIKTGLRESEILDQPIWTPSTKADVGDKDENISPVRAGEIVGQDIADQIAAYSIALYKAGRDYAAGKGIIIADTKFEFGLDESVSPPAVVLIDEVLTPDSSRFWDQAKYEVGRSQDSLDKQPLRDWLTANKLKGVQGATMTDEVIDQTRRAYVQAYYRLSGDEFFGTGA